MKFLDPLRALSPQCPNTHKLAFQVFYRQGKIIDITLLILEKHQPYCQHCNLRVLEASQ